MSFAYLLIAVSAFRFDLHTINHYPMLYEPIKMYDYPYIHQAAALIQKDPAKNWTIHGLALEIGINEFKLKIGFKRLYNKPVHHYINSQRLEIAERLLSETHLTISQIATKTGFRSTNGFSRRFHSYHHCTPSQWRNNLAKTPIALPLPSVDFYIQHSF